MFIELTDIDGFKIILNINSIEGFSKSRTENNVLIITLIGVEDSFLKVKESYEEVKRIIEYSTDQSVKK